MQVGAAVDARHPRQQILDFGLCGRRDGRTRLALRAGLAVRKYVLQKRGIISSSAQRKPGATITATAKAEVEYLLSRVARVDRRANLQPQSSAAG